MGFDPGKLLPVNQRPRSYTANLEKPPQGVRSPQQESSKGVFEKDLDARCPKIDLSQSLQKLLKKMSSSCAGEKLNSWSSDGELLADQAGGRWPSIAGKLCN